MIKNSIDSLSKESERMRQKYPDRYPIIISRACTSGLIDLKKSKYLVPGDITVGQLQYVIRNRINLRPEHALFLFCNNKLPNMSEPISSLYTHSKAPDGMIYMVYSEENVFG